MLHIEPPIEIKKLPSMHCVMDSAQNRLVSNEPQVCESVSVELRSMGTMEQVFLQSSGCTHEENQVYRDCQTQEEMRTTISRLRTKYAPLLTLVIIILIIILILLVTPTLPSTTREEGEASGAQL